MSINNKKPEAADTHIGLRVKQRRNDVGLSQEQLGEHLGITFQQVQKYEKGTNRISAGRLFNISQVLRTPVGYFFDGIESASTPFGFSEGEGQPPVSGSPGGGDESTRLVSDFQRIADPAVRLKILDLVHTLALDRQSAPTGRSRR